MYAGREGRERDFTVIYYNADGESRKRDQGILPGCQLWFSYLLDGEESLEAKPHLQQLKIL